MALPRPAAPAAPAAAWSGGAERQGWQEGGGGLSETISRASVDADHPRLCGCLIR